MKFQKIIAIYYIFNGIAMIITWSTLIATGQVPNIHEEILVFVFHWIGEFSTAALCIFSGITILKHTIHYRRFYFFTTGMALTAGFGAFVHYVYHFDTFFFVMLLFGFVIHAFFAVVNYKGFEDLFHISIGSFLYGAVNVIGVTLHSIQMASFGYSIVMLIIGALLAMALFKNKLSIKSA